jgi:sulfite reductase alpha subunit-like flavoprotein
MDLACGCTTSRTLQSTYAYLGTCQRPCLEQVPSSNWHVCCRRHVAATNTTSSHHAQRMSRESIELSCCITRQSANEKHIARPLRTSLGIRNSNTRCSTVDCYNRQDSCQIYACLALREWRKQGPPVTGCSDRIPINLGPLLHRLHGCGT